MVEASSVATAPCLHPRLPLLGCRQSIALMSWCWIRMVAPSTNWQQHIPTMATAIWVLISRLALLVLLSFIASPACHSPILQMGALLPSHLPQATMWYCCCQLLIRLPMSVKICSSRMLKVLCVWLRMRSNFRNWTQASLISWSSIGGSQCWISMSWGGTHFAFFSIPLVCFWSPLTPFLFFQKSLLCSCRFQFGIVGWVMYNQNLCYHFLRSCIHVSLFHPL